MVVAAHQPYSEHTAICTIYVLSNNKQRPPPCAVTIHKTCTDQRWNGGHLERIYVFIELGFLSATVSLYAPKH